MSADALETASSSSEDDTFSIVDRLADAIRIEEDQVAVEGRANLVQDLYEGPRKCQCCINWIDEVPNNIELPLPLPDSDADYHGPPLIIRRRVLPAQHKGQVSMHSIEIRHRKTREVLSEVFKGWDNILKTVRYLVFLAPFRPFFWRWSQFVKAVEAEEDETVKGILMQLRAIVRTELAQAFAVTKELVSHGVITDTALWTLFPPNELVYTCIDGAHRFLLVQSMYMQPGSYGEWELELTCKYVNWNGSSFGFNHEKIRFPAFSNTWKINELKAYPVRYMDDFEGIKARCLQRAAKLQELAHGIQYKAYSSQSAVAHGDESSRAGKQAQRRIILDSDNHPNRRHVSLLVEREDIMFRTGLISQAPFGTTPPGGHRPLVQPGMPGPMMPNPNPYPPGHRHYPLGRRPGPPPPPPGSYSDDESLPPKKSKAKKRHSITRTRSFESLSSSSSDDSDDGEEQELNEFHLLLCHSRMQGYCMREKEWRSFDIDRIRDIDFNPAPFDSLVLPGGYKELILSFVESQLKEGDTFDDVINGKGGGLVILLSGKPGVGKTLTAESVAEKIHAPLYKMELGDLGTDDDSSSGDEGDITTTFDLAAKWKAVLLIDECDMYLEKRSDASPKRNKLVSRFLQQLEYYPSLLFLTTNRERALDPAIYSRIHLTINYPSLDLQSRTAIWSNFLEREGGSTLSTGELDMLSNVQVNGRRIRNIVKTAKIMAKREGRKITFDDISKVMRITEGVVLD